jgi:hypothetical protein
MKLVGGSFLWVIITLRFFQWAAKFSDTDKAADQAGPAHDLSWNGAAARKVNGTSNGDGARPGVTATGS